MDISAGTKQTEQAADFPNGVPVASDASMTQWMGYVYQQQAEPTNFTGVTVTLTAIDPNHNFVTIGQATTNAHGVYDYTWTPPSVPGNYSRHRNVCWHQRLLGIKRTNRHGRTTAPPTPAPTASPVTGLATISDLTMGSLLQ